MRFRLIPMLFFVFLLFFLITDPTGAAAIVSTGFDIASAFFEGLIQFFNALAG